MASVLGGESFSHEDVAEMTAAVITKDLGAKTIDVEHLLDKDL